jgi:undecaprenyl-diphosphatase
MSTLQAIVIAILQGATELFPVSSLGHAVVLPALLNWGINQDDPSFLPFLVMLHVGTAVALLIYFWQDWWALLRGVLGMDTAHQVRESRRVLMLIIIATIPAVIVGGVLEHKLRALFGSAVIAAGFLVVNGLLLMAGEQLRSNAGHRKLSSMTMMDALIIGIWQCGALIPATIVGGLLRGIDHEGSAHFSFLIATPIILGATVLEVPKLLHADIAPGVFQLSAMAAVVAGITAFLSTAFLMRYFRGHDTLALNPFAYYCFVAGLGSIAYLLYFA